MRKQETWDTEICWKADIPNRLRRCRYQYSVPTFQIYGVWWPAPRIMSPQWVRNAKDGNKRKSQKPGGKPETPRNCCSTTKVKVGQGGSAVSKSFSIKLCKGWCYLIKPIWTTLRSANQWARGRGPLGRYGLREYGYVFSLDFKFYHDLSESRWARRKNMVTGGW